MKKDKTKNINLKKEKKKSNPNKPPKPWFIPKIQNYQSISHG